MGFRRAEKPKLADTNSAMLNRSSKPSSVILEAVWRDGDYVSDMSSEWWKLISPMFVSSMVTASSMKSFFEVIPRFIADLSLLMDFSVDFASQFNSKYQGRRRFWR